MTAKTFLVVRVRYYPADRKPYEATTLHGLQHGIGSTPEESIRSLRQNLSRHVRTKGFPAGLATATLPEEVIRTHLPDAVLGGPIPGSGSFLYAVAWDFKPLVTGLTRKDLNDRARECGGEAFETRFLHDFPVGWSVETAAAFNRWIARRDGHPPKPIAVSIRRGCSFLGEHGSRRIRLQRGLTPLTTWQVFLHELAHYRVSHHGRAFALELARVYWLWRGWSAAKALRARKVTRR